MSILDNEKGLDGLSNFLESQEDLQEFSKDTTLAGQKDIKRQVGKFDKAKRDAEEAQEPEDVIGGLISLTKGKDSRLLTKEFVNDIRQANEDDQAKLLAVLKDTLIAMIRMKPVLKDKIETISKARPMVAGDEPEAEYDDVDDYIESTLNEIASASEIKDAVKGAAGQIVSDLKGLVKDDADLPENTQKFLNHFVRGVRELDGKFVRNFQRKDINSKVGNMLGDLLRLVGEGSATDVTRAEKINDRYIDKI